MGNTMNTGIVKIYYKDKKFGFITSDCASCDVFVCYHDIAGPLMAGERVQFDFEYDQRGPHATNVIML